MFQREKTKSTVAKKQKQKTMTGQNETFQVKSSSSSRVYYSFCLFVFKLCNVCISHKGARAMQVRQINPV